jgi:predicted RNA binding protein with dsRBD fold (UPF0201 family)
MNTTNTITFQTTDTTWVMRITADRRIEVNEDVEVTEAAKKVLKAMQHMLTQQRTWVGLTDEEIDYFIVHRLRIATKENLTALIRLCESKIKEMNGA